MTAMKVGTTALAAPKTATLVEREAEPQRGYAPTPAPWVAPRVREGQLTTACTYRFYNVVDENELATIKAVIQSHAVSKDIRGSRGQDGNGTYAEFQVMLSSAQDIAKLNSALPFKQVTVGDKTVATVAYEQVDAQYFASFRTVTISGTVETVVRFRITPGASLLYSLERGTEMPVPSGQIDGTGNVAMAVRIPRGQQFVYGHSILGEVHRYLRINIETGHSEEIDRITYENR